MSARSGETGAWCAAAVLACAVLPCFAPPRLAQAAQVGQARLTVARSPEALACPDEDALAARVARLRAGAAAPELLIDVLIEREPTGFRATIRVNGTRRGVRVLRADGDRCDGLSDALTASLALLIDEEAASALPAGSASSAPAAASSAPAAPSAPAAGEGGSLLLALGGGAVAGLPRAGLGPALEGGLRFLLPGSGSLGLLGVWTPPFETSFGGGKAWVRLIRIELAACARLWGWKRAELDGCLLGVAGALQGKGKGYAPDRPVDRPFYAAGAGALGRGPLTRWLGWTARASLVVPLQRERFVIGEVGEQVGVAYTQPALGGELTVGFEVKIW